MSVVAIVAPAPVEVLGLPFPTIERALAHARTLADAVKVQDGKLLAARVELGRFLIELRKQVPHGDWEETVSRAGIHVRMARRAMALVKELTDRQSIEATAIASGGPAGPKPASYLEGRSLRSVEIDLGVRSPDRPREDVGPGVRRISLGSPDPTTSAPEIFVAPAATRIETSVPGKARVRDIDGQRGLHELFDAVDRTKARIELLLTSVRNGDPAAAAELLAIVKAVEAQPTGAKA